jgi:membrane protease YdiL (CAAX protease family)
MPIAGGLVFGYALIRTGSLAVPIGLHWGGNWAQSVWTVRLSDEQLRALTAPDLLPHLPYLAALALACLMVRATPRELGLSTSVR